MTKIFTSFLKKRKFGFVRADRSDWSVLADTENNNSSFKLAVKNRQAHIEKKISPILQDIVTDIEMLQRKKGSAHVLFFPKPNSPFSILS